MSLTPGAHIDPQKPSVSVPALAPAAPAALATPPDALTLWKCLRRCWRWAVVVGLVAAGAAGIAAWKLIPPSKHTARTLIHIPQRRPIIWPTTMENTSAQPDYQRTQVALVKSRPVLNAALKRPGIGDLETIRSWPNALEWLER